jgi:type II secretory pathway component PulF
MIKWNKLEAIQALSVFINMRKSLDEALDLVIQTQKSGKVQHQFMDLQRRLNEGINLDQAWQEIFPKDSIDHFFITNGLKRDQLAESLNDLALFVHDNNNARFKMTLRVIEPLLVIFIGLIVGLIVCSVFMALSTLTQSMAEQIF